MEELVPLEKPSLTHTSNEPEAQAWVQIGTQVPPTQDKPAASSLPPLIPEKEKEEERDEDANSEVLLHVDEEAEPFQVDDAIENEPEAEGEGQTQEDAKKEEGTEGSKKEDGHVSSKERESDYRDKRDRDRDRDSEDDEKKWSRTNSSDPKLIRARVFVGHLNTDKASRKDVEELFEPFGKILGTSLQQGYGFVQYETEESARKAIRELHGIHFFGMKLVVDKPAALKRLLGEDPRAPKPWPGDARERDYLELEYLRRRELYDRYARLEELERYYYDRYQPPVPRRDPYYDRFADRYAQPSPLDRFERYRHADFERERFLDRYPPAPASYDRPRDDPFDRRDPYDRYGAHPSRRL